MTTAAAKQATTAAAKPMKAVAKPMKPARRFALYAVAGLAAAAIGAGIWQLAGTGDSGGGGGRQIVQAELSPVAANGKRAFDRVCASCHGANGAGSSKGPPLIHDIYNPGHHADEAFYRAARLGVRQHHWHFGDMPAQPQVSGDQLTAIVRYVRELQVANGIITRPHTM